MGCDPSDEPAGPGAAEAAEPRVIAVAPAPQSIAGDPGADIVISFDRPLDPEGVSESAVRVFGRWSGVVRGELRLEAGNTRIRFVPDRPLAAGEWVTVSLLRGVRGAGGEARNTGYTWNYWTRAGPGTLDLVEVGRRPVRREGEDAIRSYGAYAGDFDGDGFSDLMIPNELATDVRVFLNDGSGDYGDFEILAVPSGSFPSTNEGADFNGDGLIDFAVGNAGNNLVSVFLGTGGGGFVHSANYRADQSVRGLCLIDADGDGHTDMVTANRDAGGSGNVTVFRNRGGAEFSRTDVFDGGGRGETACVAADANEDGILDAFIGSLASDRVTVLLGDGQGGFTTGATASTGDAPWMLASGDINGDGHVDIVSANSSGDSFSVILSDGLGGLDPAGSFPVGERPLAIDLGDLDGDGDLDVVTSNFDSSDWTIYENGGDGSFANPRSLAAGSAGSCAILHDRDNDGDLDVTGIDETDDLIFLFANE